jgi:uncharacterized integral membrane protein
MAMEHIEGAPEPSGGKVDRRRPLAIVGAVLAVGAVVAFVVQNTHQVHIEWLFFDFDWSVWFLILVTIVLTLIGEELLQWTLKRRRRTKAKRRGE